jgi:hypothetical protein
MHCLQALKFRPRIDYFGRVAEPDAAVIFWLFHLVKDHKKYFETIMASLPTFRLPEKKGLEEALQLMEIIFVKITIDPQVVPSRHIEGIRKCLLWATEPMDTTQSAGVNARATAPAAGTSSAVAVTDMTRGADAAVYVANGEGVLEPGDRGFEHTDDHWYRLTAEYEYEVSQEK